MFIIVGFTQKWRRNVEEVQTEASKQRPIVVLTFGKHVNFSLGSDFN